jgi:hypothetical protein
MATTSSLHNPECDVRIFVPDLSESAVRRADWPGGEKIRVSSLDELGDPRIDAMRTYFDAFELSGAAKSFALAYAIDSLGYEKAVLLDSDTCCYSAFNLIWTRLEQHSVLVTPHCNSPLPMDNCLPDDREMLTAGFVNGGFLAVRKGAPAMRCLSWMKDRLEQYGFFLPRLNLCSDQSWMSALPWLFPDTVGLVRDAGYNVAYWNLHERDLDLEDNRPIRCNGVPLAFFHFSGFDERVPTQLSRHSKRKFGAPTTRSLNVLLSDYAGRVRGFAKALPQVAPDRPCSRARVSSRLREYRSVHGASALLRPRWGDLIMLRIIDAYRALRGY